MVSASAIIMEGDFIRTAVNEWGTLGSGDTTSPGILHDITGTRTWGVDDYLTPGSPWDAFIIKSDQTGLLMNNNDTAEGTEISNVSLVDLSGDVYDSHVRWTGEFAGFFRVVNEYYFNDGDQQIFVTSTITALSALTNVTFLRSTDPDPDVISFGSFDTINDRGLDLNLDSDYDDPSEIPPEMWVRAEGERTRLTLGLFADTAFPQNTGISREWVTDPAFYLAGNNDGNGDNIIGVAFDVGDIALGQTVSIEYRYILAENPELLPKSITVLYPNGGETLQAGSTTQILWRTTGPVSQVDIYHSADQGSNWSLVAANEPNDGSYDWLVPSASSPAAKGLVAKSSSPVDTDLQSPAAVQQVDTYDSTLAEATRFPAPATMSDYDVQSMVQAPATTAYEWTVTEAEDLDIYRGVTYNGGWFRIPLVTDLVPPAETNFTLVLSAWDVDYNAEGAFPERCRVYINDNYLGDLIGADSYWSITTFTVPYAFINFPGENQISIKIDSLNNTSPLRDIWLLEVDWITLSSANTGGVGIEFSNFSDMGVDTDENTLFNFLNASMTLDLPAGLNGQYNINGVVRTGSTDITFAITNQVLTSGLNQVALDFDGYAINATRLNGPYEIGNLIVYDINNPANYQWLRTAFTTTGFRDTTGESHYLFSDFEGDESPVPMVVWTAPVDGAQFVPVASTIQIGFSVEMNPATITAGNIQVINRGDASNIPGVWTYANRVATFTPSSPFNAGATVDVIIGTGLTDTNGLSLPSNYGFNFTSAAIQAHLIRIVDSSNALIFDTSDAAFFISTDPDPTPDNYHPADLNRDWILSIDEVTGYGAAWKNGSGWPTAPSPIDINYVTRAGFLWKNGENYQYDGSGKPNGWVPAAP